MNRLQTAASIALLLPLAACSGGDTSGTEPGGGLEGEDRMLAWAPEEVYSVGGFSAPEWAEFGSIEGVGFDPEGNLYLLDDQTQTITQVSPTGEFVRTISGPGEGPGELARPLAMRVAPNGDLVLTDIGHRGFVRFGSDGEWIENVTADLAVEGLPSDFAFLSDGSVVGEANMRFNFSADGEDVNSGEVEVPEGRPIHRWSMQSDEPGSDIYYAWEPPAPPEDDGTELTGGDGGNVMVIRFSPLEAFRPTLNYAALPSGRLALSDSTTYRIKLIDPETGAVVGTVERPIEPIPVTDRLREAERDVQMEAATGELNFMGGGGMSFDQEAVRNAMVERVENMRFYPEVPVVEDLAADPLGRIWVQRTSGVPGEDGPTDLVTADGGYIGTLPADGLRIPDAFGPNGLIAVIETDEFDVATVRVLRVPTEMPSN